MKAGEHASSTWDAGFQGFVARLRAIARVRGPCQQARAGGREAFRHQPRGRNSGFLPCPRATYSPPYTPRLLHEHFLSHRIASLVPFASIRVCCSFLQQTYPTSKCLLQSRTDSAIPTVSSDQPSHPQTASGFGHIALCAVSIPLDRHPRLLRSYLSFKLAIGPAHWPRDLLPPPLDERELR
jgi:hypothetical protein